MAKVYISVAGNMGSGKSSLVNFLTKHFKLTPFYEPNDDNPFLERFFSDMKRWAFHSQLFFLTHKFKIQQEIDKTKKSVIQDRSIYEDAQIFATNLFKQGYISKDEFNTYMALYESMQKSIKPPDLMIYLKCNLKTLKKRIASRGRAMEQSIDDTYLKRLEILYKRWIKSYSLSPVITISTDKLDYISDFIDREDILSEIKKYL